ncbi:MAG: TonB-dependent receptor plug domain-containing protein [Vicinamibacterales bacterium]
MSPAIGAVRCAHGPRGRALATALMVLLAGGLAPVEAQTEAGGTPPLEQMSIEDLMNVDVTSVARRAQRLQDAAAAVYVLTSEDIRRSGATSIPEALRLVPGVHVGRIDSNKWSVSVRGFTGRYANKLLVLVDGRSVYTPLFSGVFWDTVRVPLDTIERIEVVRGPGATLWGANAVNGVINIITRAASAVTGVHAMVATGSEDFGLFSVTAGRQVGARTAVRADASASLVDGSVLATQDEASEDRWRNVRLGIRMDSRLTDRDDLSVQAAYTSSRIDEAWQFPALLPPFTTTYYDRSRHKAAFASVDWTRRDRSGETNVRGIGEYTNLFEVFAGERRTNLQVEAQRTQHIAAHTLIVGGSHRQSSDDLAGSDWVQFSPQSRLLTWQSAFIQDDVALAADRLHVTGGMKMEHNSYTGWERQPNLRAIVSLTPKQSVWGAISRAVRLPSRGEADGNIWVGTTVVPGMPLPAAITLEGLGRNANAEVMKAAEGGYRYQVGAVASFDVSLFDQHYTRLRNVTQPQDFFLDLLRHPVASAPGGDVMIPHLDAIVPLSFDAKGRRYGAEIAAEWRPQPRVRVAGAATFLGGYNGGAESDGGVAAMTDDPPSRMGLMRVALNLPAHLEVDTAVRAVSALTRLSVPGYVTADLRVGFRLSNVNLAVVGRNLAAGEHREFVPEFYSFGRSAAERSLLVQATFSR